MASCLQIVLCVSIFVLVAGTADEDGHHHHYYGQVTNNYGDHNKPQTRPHHPQVEHHKKAGSHEEGSHEDKSHEEGSHEEGSHEEDHHKDDHIYRFHIGGTNVGAYSYLDEAGHLKGVYLDLINKICERSHKRCHYVLDEFKRCWKTEGDHEIPGYALLSGAYDACIGFSPTSDRRNSFDFTESFTASVTASLHFRAGHVPSDPQNITGLNIGFVNGWALNAKCVRRDEGLNGDFKATFFNTYREMMAALRNGEVDATVTDALFVDDEDIVSAEHKFKCTDGGLAVMAHYGSDLIKWWNDAYKTAVEKFGVKTLCDKATERHGKHGKVFCPDQSA